MPNRQELIQQALIEAEQDLAEVEKSRREYEEREQTLRSEVEGLRQALGAYETTPPEPVTSKLPEAVTNGPPAVKFIPVANPWRILHRTEAIERLSPELDGSIHRKDLTKRLHDKGRDDTINDVSAALAYLQRNHRAKAVGNGYWLIGRNLEQEDLAMTPLSTEDS